MCVIRGTVLSLIRHELDSWRNLVEWRVSVAPVLPARRSHFHSLATNQKKQENTMNYSFVVVTAIIAVFLTFQVAHAVDGHNGINFNMN